MAFLRCLSKMVKATYLVHCKDIAYIESELNYGKIYVLIDIERFELIIFSLELSTIRVKAMCYQKSSIKS